MDLELRWLNLLQLFATDRRIAAQIFDELTALYAGNQRFYHNFDHVRQVLSVIDLIKEDCQNAASVDLAAWFHDAIYDPKAGDNEERSAAYATASLTQLRVPASTIDVVTAMILKTKNHTDTNEIALLSQNNMDAFIFLDADLAILGAPIQTYQAYAAGIRREYGWLSDEEYKNGRKKVLSCFLSWPRIYQTSRLRALLEIPARQNIQEEIRSL